jgi:hypothetical protein
LSDYRAVAAATRTLQNMLQPAVSAAMPGAVVRPQRPERVPTVTGPGEVNIYLYQVSANPAFRNLELPVRRADGTLIRRPQVALDLHYLISFYGDESKLVPQILLGAVVCQLHTQPYPHLDDIPGGPSGTDGGELTGTGLQEQADRLRFTPLPLTHDELSKLWSIFFQVPYTLSVGYLCSVILIEPDLMPQPVLPIHRASFAVGPGLPPQIESVSPQIVAAGRDAALQVRGRHLTSPGMTVRIDGVDAPPRSTSSGTLVVPVPLAVRAGVRSVLVASGAGFESNPAAFVLQPTLLEVTPAGAAPDLTAVARVEPPPAPGQQVSLLLNQLGQSTPVPAAPSAAAASGTAAAQPAPPRQYTFGPLVVRSAEAALIFPAPGLASGTYLARVQVDGVASPLTVDENPASPTFERYVGPLLVVP